MKDLALIVIHILATTVKLLRPGGLRAVVTIMDQFTRRMVGFGVQPGTVGGPNLCRMFNDAISGQGRSRYVSTDHDPLFERDGPH